MYKYNKLQTTKIWMHKLSVKMISLLMLTLSVSPLSSLPRIKTSPPNYHSATDESSAEKACSTVRSFGQSLKSVLVDKDVPLCIDAKPESR